MKIVFRVDASEQIGSGHVMRCLTLADALRKGGASCRFFCREHRGHLTSLIRERGYEVTPLPTAGVSSTDGPAVPSLDHARWLGVDWQIDAEQMLCGLGDERVDWLIVDHYALDVRWESTLRRICKHIMVIDDLADRQHDCDLLLDQNFGSSPTRYAGRVSKECTQLHGPENALIQPSYATQRINVVRRNEGVRRIFVYFGGGADVQDMTGLVLQALCHKALANIEIDIVLSAFYAHRQALEVLATQRGRVSLYGTLPDLAAHMANADLAIGAGGATTWERCCLGIPSLVVSIADNQRPACEALAAAGLIEYLGHMGSVSVEALVDTILQLQNNPSRLDRYSSAASELVDGRGVERVVSFLYRDYEPGPARAA